MRLHQEQRPDVLRLELTSKSTPHLSSACRKKRRGSPQKFTGSGLQSCPQDHSEKPLWRQNGVRRHGLAGNGNYCHPPLASPRWPIQPDQCAEGSASPLLDVQGGSVRFDGREPGHTRFGPGRAAARPLAQCPALYSARPICPKVTCQPAASKARPMAFLAKHEHGCAAEDSPWKINNIYLLCFGVP